MLPVVPDEDVEGSAELSDEAVLPDVAAEPSAEEVLPADVAEATLPEEEDPEEEEEPPEDDEVSVL